MSLFTNVMCNWLMALSKDIYQDLIDFFQAIVESDDNNITLAKGN